jgi:hypothetical protein
MATSLKTGITAPGENEPKKYLDFNGLNALWDNICDKFAPQWKSVNFDHIAKTSPTHEEDNVVLTFQNLSMPPVADGEFAGVVDHTHVNQTTWTIAAAKAHEGGSGGHAGVMSAEDKTKLDALETTAEQAVTIKGVMVGGTTVHEPTVNADGTRNWNDSLAIDANKQVAFDFIYNSTADELQIIDLNASDATKVKASVKINDMLGDSIKEAMIKSVELSSTDNFGNTGTFIKITFIVKNQSDDTNDNNVVYCNVADLIETYTKGDGIDISQNSNGLDGAATATTISVIAPAIVSNDNKIGGIKSNKIYTGSVTNWKNTSGTTAPKVQNLGTQSGRYFGIETDKVGHAFVNVPSASISLGTPTERTDSINNTQSTDTFTAMTGISIGLSEDGNAYTYTPEYTTFTVNQESELAVNDTKIEQANIQLNGSTAQTITYKSEITVGCDETDPNHTHDHEIKTVNSTFTITESELEINSKLNGDGTVFAKTEAISPGTGVGITVLETVSRGDHHEIIKEPVTITVNDPLSIEIGYIEGLVWSIPVKRTDTQFRNEEDYENSASHVSGANNTDSNE